MSESRRTATDGEMERLEDELSAALTALIDSVEENIHRNQAIREQAERLRSALARGDETIEVIEGEQRPLTIELVSANIAALQRSGVELRRAEARIMHAYGHTLQEVADHFGVSRQRVSALLRDV